MPAKIVNEGQDNSGNPHPLITDTTGLLLVQGTVANATAVSGNPFIVAGSDGTNTRDIITDGVGHLLPVGGFTGLTGAASGSVTTPTAGQAIATTATLPAGNYRVEVYAGYGVNGDVANNMKLLVGTTVVIPNLPVPGIANGTPVRFVAARLALNGSQAISVNAIAAGASVPASVYNAVIVYTQII